MILKRLNLLSFSCLFFLHFQSARPFATEQNLRPTSQNVIDPSFETFARSATFLQAFISGVVTPLIGSDISRIILPLNQGYGDTTNSLKTLLHAATGIASTTAILQYVPQIMNKTCNNNNDPIISRHANWCGVAAGLGFALGYAGFFNKSRHEELSRTYSDNLIDPAVTYIQNRQVNSIETPVEKWAMMINYAQSRFISEIAKHNRLKEAHSYYANTAGTFHFDPSTAQNDQDWRNVPLLPTYINKSAICDTETGKFLKPVALANNAERFVRSWNTKMPIDTRKNIIAFVGNQNLPLIKPPRKT